MIGTRSARRRLTLMALLAAAACSSAPTQTGVSRTTSPVASKEVYLFEDVATMIATSDLVIRGRVLSTVSGPPNSDHEPSGRVNLATVQIEETFHGRVDTPTITIQQAGHDASGKRYIVNGRDQLDTGDRGFFFLMAPRGRMLGYAAINSQGFYIEQGDGHRGSNGHDELVRQLNSKSPAELRNEILRGVELVDKGAAKPQRPGGTG